MLSSLENNNVWEDEKTESGYSSTVYERLETLRGKLNEVIEIINKLKGKDELHET